MHFYQLSFHLCNAQKRIVQTESTSFNDIAENCVLFAWNELPTPAGAFLFLKATAEDFRSVDIDRCKLQGVNWHFCVRGIQLHGEKISKKLQEDDTLRFTKRNTGRFKKKRGAEINWVPQTATAVLVTGMTDAVQKSSGNSCYWRETQIKGNVWFS